MIRVWYEECISFIRKRYEGREYLYSFNEFKKNFLDKEDVLKAIMNQVCTEKPEFKKTYNWPQLEIERKEIVSEPLTWKGFGEYIQEKYHETVEQHMIQAPTDEADLPAKTADKKEDAPVSSMHQAAGACELTLEDLVLDDDDLDLDDLDLDDLDLDDEFDEEDESVQDEGSAATAENSACSMDAEERILVELKNKYGDTDAPVSYAALKKENPEINWSGMERYIREEYDQTPAAYFKAEGIIGSAKKAAPACPAETELNLNGATTIDVSQFSGNKTLKKVIIPEGVTEIGSCAFRVCSSLEEVVFPKSLREIGEFAFENCSALKKVRLQEGVEKIGMHAFAAINKLMEVKLPDSLNWISRAAFGSGDNLSHATVHMSIDLACRLRDNESVNDPVLARRYVIGGVEYESMPAFFEALEKGKTELKTDRQNNTKAKQDAQLKETLKRLKETEDRKRVAYDNAEKMRLAIYALEGKRISDADKLETIASEFDKLGDYPEAAAKAIQCRDFADAIRGSYYKSATEKLENASTVSEVETARNIFQALGIGYRNASGYLTECRKKEGLLKQLADLAARKYRLDQSQEVSESQALEYETLAEGYKNLEGEAFRYNACMGKAEGIRKAIEEKKQLREKIDALYQKQRSFRLLFNGRKRKELQQEIEALEEKLEKM